MLRIGLTGNIGSGKSVVAKIFEALGIPVYHADEESKKFLELPAIQNEIIRAFGYGVLDNIGHINRRSVASLVFTDEKALKTLNSILHPKVREDFRQWTAGHPSDPYVVQEAAIIFESGFRAEYDYIIHVSCPKEIAIDRVMKRDGIDVNSVLRRLQFQLDDEEKGRLSDFVIVNDGDSMVIPQVLSIHHDLLKKGSKRNGDVSARETDTINP